jgi:hypothetical protein
MPAVDRYHTAGLARADDVYRNGGGIVSKKKKVNPNRIPATKADVEKAKKQAVDEAVSFAWAVFFTVMRDKEGYGTKVRLPRLWARVRDLIDSITKGYVSVADLKEELKKQGIILE